MLTINRALSPPIPQLSDKISLKCFADPTTGSSPKQMMTSYVNGVMALDGAVLVNPNDCFILGSD